MKFQTLIALLIATVYFTLAAFADQGYIIVDTAQTTCYSDSTTLANCPAEGDNFYGQDSSYTGSEPNYLISTDNLTVLDRSTGLTWIKSPDFDEDGDINADDKMSFVDAQSYPILLNADSYGGYDDWRLPTIKELYSLILFSGIDPSGYSETNTSGLTPFIDTDYFDFNYGDTSASERIIDAQYWSATEYVSTTMNADHTVFGVNFADGRIKGYGSQNPKTGDPKTQFVRFVRGNTAYGKNNFVDNEDGTITDLATGLMWQQSDSQTGLNWQESLAYAESLTLAAHTDWRLPNAKELQSIVDYTRSPDTTASPAIDPIFNVTSITNEGEQPDFPFYWSSTTHEGYIPAQAGRWAAYVAFGRGLGFMAQPPNSENYVLLDVHGAGCQRSDPKYDNGTDYSNGHGPQGDVVRIENFVRCVRGKSNVVCQTLTANGDTNCDCKIDLKDFAHLASQWNKTECGKCSGKDLTGEGSVDINDLAILSTIWLEGN